MEILFSGLVGIGAFAFFLFVAIPIVFIVSKTWYVSIPFLCATLGGWEGFFFGVGINVVLIFAFSYLETNFEISEYLERLKIRKEIIDEARKNPKLLPRLSFRAKFLNALRLSGICSTFFLIPVLISTGINISQPTFNISEKYLFAAFFLSLTTTIILIWFAKNKEYDYYEVALQKETTKRLNSES